MVDLLNVACGLPVKQSFGILENFGFELMKSLQVTFGSCSAMTSPQLITFDVRVKVQLSPNIMSYKAQIWLYFSKTEHSGNVKKLTVKSFFWTNYL